MSESTVLLISAFTHTYSVTRYLCLTTTKTLDTCHLLSNRQPYAGGGYMVQITQLTLSGHKPQRGLHYKPELHTHLHFLAFFWDFLSLKQKAVISFEKLEMNQPCSHCSNPKKNTPEQQCCFNLISNKNFISSPSPQIFLISE
jgi:hypothetical protein